MNENAEDAKEVTKIRVTQEQFIAACFSTANDGGTHEDVANQLGVKVQSVKSRHAKYREMGLNLPEFPKKKRGKSFDLQAAQDQIAKLERERSAI